MVSPLVDSQLALLALIWLCVLLHRPGSKPSRTTPPVLAQPKRPSTPEITPCEGLTQNPHGVLGERDAAQPNAPAPVPPEPMPPSNRRPRLVDTSPPLCPHAGCRYRGWRRLGNLRANGHPHGGPWRQCQGTACAGDCPEHPGTIFHGTQATVELSVHVLACVAAGLGMRATARVFEVDANTGRQGLVEAAAQRQACSAYVLGDVHVRQRPRDELSAVWRSVKDGESSAAQAIPRLERSRHWVWTAIDPESTLLLTIEGGPRPLAIAQRVGHQVVGVLAPGWVPVWLRAGVKGSLPAMVGHCGDWRHPERRPDNGPWPKPRWMPRPGLRYAQGIKQYRRKRLVGVKHPVVCGPLGTIAQVFAACGWKINTAFVERRNLDIRPRVAAGGRRVTPLCKGEDGLRHPLALGHVEHNFVLAHASVRQP